MNLPHWVTPEYLEQLKKVARQIADFWVLASFAGKTEAEVIIHQTVRVAAANQESQQIPCSFSHHNLLLNTSAGGGIDNPEGYRICKNRGWIEAESVKAADLIVPKDIKPNKNGHVIVLWPMPALLRDIEEHIKRDKEKEKQRKKELNKKR